jgi:hypothetical protein
LRCTLEGVVSLTGTDVRAAAGRSSLTITWERPSRRTVGALAAIELVTGLPAIPSGIALVRNGMGMPADWIEHSLLPDFTIPGILLLVLIGGGMTASGILSLRRPDPWPGRWRWRWAHCCWPGSRSRP